MQVNLRIAIWNANGLSNHTEEVTMFLNLNNIDILLVSETHFTTKSYFKIVGYDLISANHPRNKAHGGSAILIRSEIKYESLEEVKEQYLQAAGVKIKCYTHELPIYSVYFPPRFNLKADQYVEIFKNFGPKFFVGGDFNAKHPWWGSRLINPKGKELERCITQRNFSILSTGTPTYWPSDPKKIPDLLDFVVYSGIPSCKLSIQNSNDLSSDHSPLIVIYNDNVYHISKKYKILRPKTDLESFQYWIDKHIDLNAPLETGIELEAAIESFTNLIHEAAYLSSPTKDQPISNNHSQVPSEILLLINTKRRLRKAWQENRYPAQKRDLNRAKKQLKLKLADFKNQTFSSFIKNLEPTKNDDHSLWKATKYLKRPTKRKVAVRDSVGVWCRSDEAKTEAFAKHLFETFQPNSVGTSSDEVEILNFLESPCQMDLPISKISNNEVTTEIHRLNNYKSPGYDYIDSKVVKALPEKAIQFLTIIYNAILNLYHYPTQWKCAIVVMVQKPNKPENSVKSYRPISLLVTFSKIFERIFLQRMLPVIEDHNIIPEHQFGFRVRHGTPEQCHRVANVITAALEEKKYCSAAFLDVEQAFDRVWHQGLLFKVKKILPAHFYLVLKSYLSDRHFYVRHGDASSEIYNINAGVPQGSVLGPVLYTIFTADMPNSEKVEVATFADDTAFIAYNESPVEASYLLQNQLQILESWLNKWKIKVNSEKSTHVTFTLRREQCPAVFLNNKQIPTSDRVKYLGMHLDRRLTWKSHIQAKQQQLKIKTTRMHWLLGRNSQLSLENKIRIYKAILKPIWTYGIQLWGTASNSNVEILQRYQSKTLRSLVNAPWFITNESIHKDLGIPFVKNEIRKYSTRYLKRLSNHINPAAICLLDTTNETIRLKRNHILDLPFL